MRDVRLVRAANCDAPDHRSRGAQGNVNRAPPRCDRSHPWQDASGRSARHGSGRSARHALGGLGPALAGPWRVFPPMALGSPRTANRADPTPSVAKLTSCAPNCRCSNFGHNFGVYIWCEMAVYGYARVSTTGQTLATQKAMLLTAGVESLANTSSKSVIINT